MVIMRLHNILAANKAGMSTILNPYNGISSTSSPQWIPPAIVKQ